MSNICSSCGAQLSPGARFCNACGTEVPSPQGTSQYFSPMSPSPNAGRNRKPSLRKLLISVITLLLVVTLGITLLPGLISSLRRGKSVRIEEVDGQPYANRAVTIRGKGFGEYDSENSRAYIDSKDTPIISWSNQEITLLVPEDVPAGKKEIKLANPPLFKKKTVKHKFLEQTKTELLKAVLSPDQDNIIEGEGFMFIAPKGSVAQTQEITIYQYREPSKDDSPYRTVVEEYEITGTDSDHLFFEQPVYFGVEVDDAEEAARSSFQIFDEISGLWVSAETWYSEDEPQVYLATTHFSSFRRFADDMWEGFGRFKDRQAKKIQAVTDKLKEYADKGAEFIEDISVDINDYRNGDFSSVTDAAGYAIVYYRNADAKKDPTIRDKACVMAAAFAASYRSYKDLFGEEGVPSVTKKARISGIPGINAVYEEVPSPISVYIDPRYNGKGAQSKYATTGNIIMPSEYPNNDLVSTCAHELFHAVQYELLGLKTLYMSTTGLKDLVDNRYTGNKTEVYRFFANNAWFMEATAEYAARFIATGEGIDAPIHQSIEANKAYYTCNGTHEYGISSFLDYVLSTRRLDVVDRKTSFKEMWDTVTGNYSMLTSINMSFSDYVYDKLSDTMDTVYRDFWKDAFTNAMMPEVTAISGGLQDIKAISRQKLNSSMEIKTDGVGILRYGLSPQYVWKDETALTRSFWFDVSPDYIQGSVYRLDGLDMSDRVLDPPYEGDLNTTAAILKTPLIPYSKGETMGIIAILSPISKDTEAKVTFSSTSIAWDNQKDIEKKVSNTTLRSTDKLKFTPTLPKQKAGDSPFLADIIINNDPDFKTERKIVENGKAFEVNPPMRDLPPDRVSVNIKIYQDGELVHEYQSINLKGEAKVDILGPEAVTYELDEKRREVEHTFTAEASPNADYDFQWDFGDGLSGTRTEGGSKSEVSHTYEAAGRFTAKVILYDKKGDYLSSDSIQIILEDKSPAASIEPTKYPKPTADPTAVPRPEAEPEYAWVRVETKTYEAADYVKEKNKSYEGIYEFSASASPGSYSVSWKYVGESDDYYEPPMVHGEGATSQATFSSPPSIIKAGETVSLSLSLAFTENTLSFFDGNAAAGADFDRWDVEPGFISNDAIEFKNKDDKATFRIYSSVKYSSNNVLSINETITAVAPSGREEGDRIAIRTSCYNSFSLGTNYIYEWQQVK